MEKNSQHIRGCTVEQLVMIGFTEKLRALEVLSQLQRLKFDWSADLKAAVAVEVERDGKLRLHHSQLLDPSAGLDDVLQWKAILNAIVPLPHMPRESTAEIAVQVRLINAEGSKWLKGIPLDRDFIRNAAALLRPGNSAILAILRDSRAALAVLSGYSQVVLHTSFVKSHGGTESTS
jgi:uncharacterized membrane protein